MRVHCTYSHVGVYLNHSYQIFQFLTAYFQSNAKNMDNLAIALHSQIILGLKYVMETLPYISNVLVGWDGRESHLRFQEFFGTYRMRLGRGECGIKI